MKRRRSLALAAFAFGSCSVAIGCDSIIGANFDRTGNADGSAANEDGASNADGSTTFSDGAAIDGSKIDAAIFSFDSGPPFTGDASSPALCGDMSGYDPASPWPVGGYCPTRANHTTAPALVKPKLLWRYDFAASTSGYEFVGGPVIDGNGTIYAPAFALQDGGAPGAVLFAIDKNGSLVFAASLPGTSPNTPAIGHDGTIYVQTAGTLTALHPDGSVAWSRALTSPYSSMPLILPAGNIVVLDGHQLAVVAPAGNSQTTFSIGTTFSDPYFAYSAAISPSGVIYAVSGPPEGSLNGAFYGVDSDGASVLSSTVALNQEPQAAPMFDVDGNLVVSTSSGIAIFTPTGASAGFTSTGITPSQQHGAQNGNTIWFPTNMDGPFTYDTKTQALTQLTTEDAFYSSFAVVGDGSLVFARRSSSLTPEARVEGWNTDATSKWVVAMDSLGSDLNGIAVGANGTVYVPFGPTLYAVGD